MDGKVLELLNQLIDGQKRMEARLESLETEVKDIKEDIRAIRIETSRAFSEAVNPTISKVENIELDVKMLKRIVTNQ